MNERECTLLIPSAKIVPESLQNLGKLPAVIYPVSQRIVFDYLYTQYADISDSIKVMCYENSEDVIKKLAPYGAKVVVNVLDELRDLGYTIYRGLDDESGTVIINFADTIVTDNINGFDGDCFFYSEDYFSEAWTFFSMKDGNHGAFTSITDKKKIDSDNKAKLFVGVFKILDPVLFRECLEHAFNEPDNEISSFYQALSEYNNIRPFTAIKTGDWFDTGHADKYFNSRLEVSAREFNHITIDRARGILYKSSDNKDKFIHEIKWYLKLPSDLEYTHPRIFNYSMHYSKPFISMEYYSYHTIHELFLYGDLNFHQWQDIFLRIRSVCNDFMRYTVKGNDIQSALEDMYLTKTLERLDILRSSKNFSSFFEDTIIINGKEYPPLNKICGLLKKYIPELLYNCDNFSIIHGDLCFANIMIDSSLSFIKLVDPRGNFGNYDIYGDPRYDLAKLLHSIDGKYDFIIKDLFRINFDPAINAINYEINNTFDLCSIFNDIFKPDMNSLKLIESLLFLSMIPLHKESLNHQLVMLATGIEILNQAINLTKE